MVASDAESARLAALGACAIVDTPREPDFDNIVFTLSQVLRLNMAAIVLVTQESGWVKAMVGPADAGLWQAMPIMRQVATSGQLIVLSDMLADSRCRAAANGAATTYRFCAVAPLLGPGCAVVGCLCALSPAVRSLMDHQIVSLSLLARQASELICLRVPDLNLTLVA